MNKKPPVTPIFPRNNGPVLPEKMSTQDYLKAAGQRALNRYPMPSGQLAPNPFGVGFGVGFGSPVVKPPHDPTPSWLGSPEVGIVSEAPRFELNCITIAQHIDTCPICSKLYDTDKTLYLLVIFGLLIACFLLVRRLLNF